MLPSLVDMTPPLLLQVLLLLRLDDTGAYPLESSSSWSTYPLANYAQWPSVYCVDSLMDPIRGAADALVLL